MDRSPDWLKGTTMKDREHFTHRIDMWDADGTKVIEHLANVEDFEVAMATYHAACLRWPMGRITLRQDGRVIVERGVPL